MTGPVAVEGIRVRGQVLGVPSPDTSARRERFA